MKRLALAALLLAGVRPPGPPTTRSWRRRRPAAAGTRPRAPCRRVLQEEGISGNVQVTNVPGAGGTIGLAQFVNQAKGDPEALIVGGYVMVGAILTNNSPVDLDDGDADRPADRRVGGDRRAGRVSDIQTMADLVAKLKADPGAVSWGGGSAGGTDHIPAGLIAKAVGVDPTKVNYIAFSGGGEALAAILGGQVTVGISGYGEFESQIEAGDAARCSRVSGDERVPRASTRRRCKEAGVDVALRELAHGRRGARHHRRAEGGDHRRHREAGELRRLEEDARRPRAGSTPTSPATSSRRSSPPTSRRPTAILKDIGLVQ